MAGRAPAEGDRPHQQPDEHSVSWATALEAGCRFGNDREPIGWNQAGSPGAPRTVRLAGRDDRRGNVYDVPGDTRAQPFIRGK